MGSDWLATLGFLAAATVVASGVLVGSSILRVRGRATALKSQAYECGEEPEGTAWLRFHPRYYVVALFFVLFDVEAAFLLPWATDVRGLGLAATLGALVFVAILMLGWGYAVRKGVLKWQ